MKLLPQNPMTEAWRAAPGDRTTLLVLTDWLEEQSNPDAVALRKVVRLWESGLFRAKFGTKGELKDALGCVPPEWCGVAAAGVAARCALWLGDSFREPLGHLVADLVADPEEDASWGAGHEPPPPAEDIFRWGVWAAQQQAPGGRLGRRAREAGKAVSAAIGVVSQAESGYRKSRSDDALRAVRAASAVSYATCAASRVAKMRVWRGEPRSGLYRGAGHPQDLFQSAALEAAKSRAFAHSARSGRSSGWAESAVHRGERRWQVAWVAALAHAAGFPAGPVWRLVGYGERKRIARLVE